MTSQAYDPSHPSDVSEADEEKLDSSSFNASPIFRGSSFVSDVSMTEALADEDDDKLAMGRLSVLEYSDTSEDPSHRKTQRHSSSRSERKSFRSKSPSFLSDVPQAKEGGRIATDRKQRFQQKSSTKRTAGVAAGVPSRKDYKRSVKQRNKLRSKNYDSSNWVTQLAASFRSASPSINTENDAKRLSNISSLNFRDLRPDNPHEGSPLLDPFGSGGAFKSTKRRASTKRPNYIQVAATFLRDYEASRPPVFGGRGLEEISERQVKLHEFRYGNVVSPVVLGIATVALFLGCFFEGFGSQQNDHTALTALNAFAVVVYSFDLLIARDLHKFDMTPRLKSIFGDRAGPFNENLAFLSQNNSFDQPLMLFCGLLLLENCTKLAISPDRGVIILSSIFKPVALFYVSSLAREALNVLGMIMPEVVRVLSMDGLMHLLFAAIATRLFNKHDGYEHLGASLLSLFELSSSAGNPGVWLPFYEQSQFSAVFFVSFIVISVFFMQSLILSVVFHAYMRAAKEMRQKSAAQREVAIQLAFKSLQFHHRLGQDASMTPPSGDCIPLSLVQQILEIIRPHYSALKINALLEIVAASDQKYIDYATFHAKIRKALNASIRTTRTASTLAMTIELAAVLVSMINFVFVIVISSRFHDRSLSITAILMGLGITFAAGAELVIRFNPFRIPDFTPLTRMDTAFDGIALVAASVSFFGFLLLIFSANATTAVNCMLIGRALDMVRIMRFFQFFRDLIRRSSEVLFYLVGPSFLVLSTLHVFVYVGMCLWGGNISSESYHIYDLNNFNSYQEGIVTMFQVLVVDDWAILAETFLLASRFNSPLIVYTFLMVAYFAGVLVMSNVLTSFFLEAYLTKSNEDTDGPAEVTAHVHKEKENQSERYGFRFASNLYRSQSPGRQQATNIPRRDDSDHDADSEGSSESGLFEFDVYERNGVGKLLDNSPGGSRRDDVLHRIGGYLEIFESLSTGRQPVGWLVCDQQTMDRFGNQLFQELAHGYLGDFELQAVVTDMHSELLVLAPTSNSGNVTRVRKYRAKDLSNSYLRISGSLLSQNPTLSIFVARVIDSKENE
ncbi:hypothetical protein FisN_10Hh105 [Fistulifera solaris]|uniref:Ion transport domain-containing protein n=1 Tax=Fistulifera solaris TaxID=1519565 RepID=A0A1Z5JXS6_FISSO|nr:hypothetical protein FisN_10Hh105 [Fistulifera solaris]|eukprot:GAX18682.1 hypothetical protein FisN_10Hh105 [Fistulifera solaris]